MTNPLDKSNLSQVIKNTHKQVLDGLSVTKNIKITGKFNNVIICGMGGSAFPADLVREYLTEPLPISVCRDYHLPRETTKKSLIIISSYSGNTTETIATLKEALRRRLKIVALTTGGKIETICQKNKIPLVKYPIYNPTFPSRMATLLAFTSILMILAKAKLIKNRASELKKLPDFLTNLHYESRGKSLAKKIFGTTPIIYAPGDFKAVGYAWKIRLNENSKVMAFNYFFPELNHNEMQGFAQIHETPDTFHFLFLRPGYTVDSETKKRMTITKKIITGQRQKVSLVDTQGTTKLERMWASLNLSAWTSYWLAILYRLDPTTTPLINEFKNQLSKP